LKRPHGNKGRLAWQGQRRRPVGRPMMVEPGMRALACGTRHHTPYEERCMCGLPACVASALAVQWSLQCAPQPMLLYSLRCALAAGDRRETPHVKNISLRWKSRAAPTTSPLPYLKPAAAARGPSSDPRVGRTDEWTNTRTDRQTDRRTDWSASARSAALRGAARGAAGKVPPRLRVWAQCPAPALRAQRPGLTSSRSCSPAAPLAHRFQSSRRGVTAALGIRIDPSPRDGTADRAP
jgi:hypothetical protein